MAVEERHGKKGGGNITGSLQKRGGALAFGQSIEVIMEAGSKASRGDRGFIRAVDLGTARGSKGKRLDDKRREKPIWS